MTEGNIPLFFDKSPYRVSLYMSSLWGKPAISLWRNRLAQIGADKEDHLIRAACRAERNAVPPPVPDALSSQPQVKLRVGGWVIAIAQPERQTYARIARLAGA